VAPIHIPHAGDPAAWSAWLGEEPASADVLRAMLEPFPAERMRAYPVSARVNSVKNDEPSLIEAVAGP
jgi:putative SOS response-associated peptidase YedK